MTIIPNAYGYTAINKKATQAWPQAQQVINDMLAQHVTRLRYQIPWGAGSANPVEYQAPSGGTYFYNWTNLDDIVARCEASGIWLQFCIQQPPSWHTTTYSISGNMYAYATAADVGKFASDLVSRYSTPLANGGRGVLPSLDIGNEDYDPFGAAQAVRDAGGTYLGQAIAAVGPLVLAINPHLYISSACLLQQSNLPHISTWLGNLYATGAASYMRNTTIHFYKGNDGPPENNGFAFSQFWQAVQAGNAANGYPNMPIWITECGWDMNSDANPTPTYPTPATNWSYFQTMLDEARYSGAIEVMMWYTIGSNDTKSQTVHGAVDGQPEVYQQPLFNNYATYAANYPQLQGAVGTSGEAAVEATSRDGVTPQATGRDGIVSASSR